MSKGENKKLASKSNQILTIWKPPQIKLYFRLLLRTIMYSIHSELLLVIHQYFGGIQEQVLLQEEFLEQICVMKYILLIKQC